MLIHSWILQNVSKISSLAFSMKSSKHATKKKSFTNTYKTGPQDKGKFRIKINLIYVGFRLHFFWNKNLDILMKTSLLIPLYFIFVNFFFYILMSEKIVLYQFMNLIFFYIAINSDNILNLQTKKFNWLTSSHSLNFCWAPSKSKLT